MEETVVGFHGGRCVVDGGVPFYFGFEATEALYNGKPIDLQWKGAFELTRTQPADDYFMEAKLKPKTKTYLSFDYSISVTRVSPSSVQVVIDKGEPFAVGINPVSIKCGDTEIDFTAIDTFTYERSSGEDPKCLVLTLKKRRVRVRVWFAHTLQVGFIAIVHHDSEMSAIFKELKLPGKYTDDRMEAYLIQEFGWRALKKGTKDEEWEPIILTDEEREFIENRRREKRQREFEESREKVAQL